MLFFDTSGFPVQFLRPPVFERMEDFLKTRDTAKAESRERFVSVVLLLCVLAAGVYGEILRYAF